MIDRHQAVVDELRDGIADIDSVEWEPPEALATDLAAQHRSRLRNSAYLAQMSQKIARRTGNSKDAETHGKQLSTLIRQIAELDLLSPQAKKRMAEMDEQVRSQEG
jgi:hypothetical protein